MRKEIVRIGGASGFWGDSSLAAPQLVNEAKVDYLTFDYLAELTMSILSRARDKNPEAGYAEDFVTVAMSSILHAVGSRGVKVLSNAGGVNPRACAKALEQLAAKEGVNIKVAVVEGDDLLPIMTTLQHSGLKDLHSGQPLPAKLMSANAYLGALPIVEALKRGAQVVITGRCVDSALPLAALMYEFDWASDDYDKLAAGSLAGHLIECGPQATGGLFTDWEQIDGWDNIGYPIVECSPDGSFIVTKPDNTGGLVSPATVAEQMLYEIGDPSAYLLPDVVCDFSDVRMNTEGKDRVKVDGARGKAPSDMYKVSATYSDGWRCVANVVLIGGKAELKAKLICDAILARTRRIMRARGFDDFRLTYSEIIGTEPLFGPHSRIPANREVVLKLVVEHSDRQALEIFATEVAPSGTASPPGFAGFLGGGRPWPSPLVKLFSFLYPKSSANITVTINGQKSAVVGQTSSHEARQDNVPSVYTPFVDPYAKEGGLSPGTTVEVPLIRLAHGRSGDKGDSVNIGIIARDPRWLPVLYFKLTAERVQEYFAHLVKGPVTRFDVPGIRGFNFLLLAALGGGGMASPRSDPLGKGFAQMLLDMPIEIPVDLLREIGGSTCGTN